MNFEKIGRKIKLIKLQKAVDKNFKPLIFSALVLSIIITFSGVALINATFMFKDDFVLFLLCIFLVSFIAFLPVGVLLSLVNKKQIKEEQMKKIERGNLNIIGRRLSFKD